jgi:hypothetical protein
MSDLETLLMRDRLTDKAVDLWKTYLTGQDAVYELNPGTFNSESFSVPVPRPLDRTTCYEMEDKIRESIREAIRRGQSRWIAYFSVDGDGQDIMTLNLRLGHITWRSINYFPVPTGRWLVTKLSLREVYQEVEKLLHENAQFSLEQ